MVHPIIILSLDVWTVSAPGHAVLLVREGGGRGRLRHGPRVAVLPPAPALRGRLIPPPRCLWFQSAIFSVKKCVHDTIYRQEVSY